MSASHQPTAPLWKDGAFGLFWTGRAVSLLGTAITAVVLPILIYRLTASAFLTSLLAALEVIPYLLFGLFAGALADQVNRRWLMVGCDLLNMLLLASIPVAAWLHALTILQVFAVALLSATAFVWFDAANFGAIPTLVGRERIVAAYSALWTTDTIVQIIGPAIGGLLAATIGPALSLGFDALSYLLSAVTLALIPRALSTLALSDGTSQAIVKRTLGGIREGIGFLWRQRLVRTLTLLGFGNSLTGGAVMGLLVVYAVQSLGLPTTDARIGWLFTAGALGSLLATVSLSRLTRLLPIGWVTLAAMTCDLALLAALAWTSSLYIALVLYACWQGCYTLTTMNGIVLRQLVTPATLQSRVNAY
ncbi:MAG: MFS transporter, partial [Chloroflexota bacterium]|nr:MFS transporter [Chloroflexota bacterium]